jgi:hypothetical protein
MTDFRTLVAAGSSATTQPYHQPSDDREPLLSDDPKCEPELFVVVGEAVYDEASDELLGEFDTCEHGLSAALCGGPQHWYDHPEGQYR